MVILLLIFFCILFFIIKNKRDTYLIEFDSNGGSLVENQKILDGNFVIKPEDPIYNGFTFDGWYLNDEKYNFDTKVHKKMILVAKWNINSSDVSNKDTKVLENEEGKITDKTEEKSFQNNSTNYENTNTKNDKNDDNNKIIHVSDISLSSTNITLYVGDSIDIDVYIIPNNATYKYITWESSNNNVAIVDNGKIKAVGAGSVKIIVTVDNISTSLIVNVTEKKIYKYEIVDVSSSTIGQCYIYIKDSNENYVSGTVTITYISGAAEDVSIPSEGLLWPNKKVIASITNVRGK